jgi:hypothetical protein
MHIYSFEKLEVWQLARQFRKDIYIITKGFPADEKFGFTSQLRRAASSIGDNIAEGTGKLHPKKKPDTPQSHLAAPWKLLTTSLVL